jgi:hypothetical protein
MFKEATIKFCTIYLVYLPKQWNKFSLLVQIMDSITATNVFSFDENVGYSALDEEE